MTFANRPLGAPAGRLNARATVKPVNFICMAPQATKVSVVGDFNQWNPDRNPLEKSFDGSWRGAVEMSAGHHQYAFCVDGVLQLDPRAQGVSRNPKGERVSLMAVS
jgi:1,4-alpha-glucan branching enzyme